MTGLVKYADDERVTMHNGHGGFYFQLGSDRFLITENTELGWCTYYGPDLQLWSCGDASGDDAIDTLLQSRVEQ